jgi:hypothetical protein
MAESGESDSIPVALRIKPLVSIRPAVAVLDSTVGSGASTRVVAVADEPFEVLESAISDPKIADVVAPIPQKPGSVQVSLSTDAGRPEGRYAATLTIKTNNPRFPTIKVPIFILVRPQAR